MPIPIISKAHRLTRREAVDYLRNEWGVRRTHGTLANLAISVKWARENPDLLSLVLLRRH